MKSTVALLLVLEVLLVVFICGQANNKTQTIILERGSRGMVPCLPVSSHELTPGEIGAVYWYIGQIERTSLLISKFRGVVTPLNGVPEGVYDINNESSLIIQNVTDLDEASYWYRLKPRQKAARDGNVTVNVKVTPKESFPSVTGCDPSLSDPTVCSVSVPNDTSKHQLTCQVHNAKPAAEIRWFHVKDDNRMTLLNATQKTDWFGTNNTYTTSASIRLKLSNDDVSRYRCETYGLALGDRSGSHVTATIAVIPPDKADITSTTSWNAETTAAATDDPFEAIIIAIGVLLMSITLVAAIISVRMKLKMKLKKKSSLHLAPTTEPRV